MKIECSGPNGETFECEWEFHGGNLTTEFPDACRAKSVFERDAAQEALKTWCEMIAKGAEGEKK